MNTLATLGELVKFVLKHRRGNAFRRKLETEIAEDIYRAAKADTLLYTKDEHNQLTGILVCKQIKSNNTVHVRDVLVTDHSALRQIAAQVQLKWPEQQITAFRRFKFTRYNTPKLLMKITNQQTKGEVI